MSHVLLYVLSVLVIDLSGAFNPSRTPPPPVVAAVPYIQKFSQLCSGPCPSFSMLLRLDIANDFGPRSATSIDSQNTDDRRSAVVSSATSCRGRLCPFFHFCCVKLSREVLTAVRP